MSISSGIESLKVESLTVGSDSISAIFETGEGLVEKKYQPSQLPANLIFEVGAGRIEVRVLSHEDEKQTQSGPWSAEKDARRRQLIDKKIQRTIGRDELRELTELQTEAMEHYDRIAPPPVDGARKLHERLVAMMQQQEK